MWGVKESKGVIGKERIERKCGARRDNWMIWERERERERERETTRVAPNIN